MSLFQAIAMHFKTRKEKKELYHGMAEIENQLRSINSENEKIIKESHHLVDAIAYESERYKNEKILVAKKAIAEIIKTKNQELKILENKLPLLNFKRAGYQTQKEALNQVYIELKNPSNLDRLENLRHRTVDVLANWDEQKNILEQITEDTLEGQSIVQEKVTPCNMTAAAPALSAVQPEAANANSNPDEQALDAEIEKILAENIAK